MRLLHQDEKSPPPPTTTTAMEMRDEGRGEAIC